MQISRFFFFTCAALAVAVASPTLAKNKNTSGHCPPGLAKKNPPCVPPGLAKKGDFVRDYDHIILDAGRNGLDDRYGWYRLGENLYVRTDKKTGEIIELFKAIDAVLN